MQIMASVEADTPNDSDDDDDDDDDEVDEYDDETLQDIIKGKLPLARGGTEESEGGDYNPILEIFRSTAARRSSPGPREKRMKH